MVLPFEAKEKMVAAHRSAETAADQISEAVGTQDDIFSFDLPEEPSSAPVQRNENPFDFDEQTKTVSQSSSSNFEDDVFADLLESTSQADESPFAAAHMSSAPSVSAEKPSDVSSGQVDFDLESFSWDDAPAETTATTSKVLVDDFDTLFGETKDSSPK